MSKRAFTAIGIVLIVAVAGVVIFTQLRPQAAVMSNGPGMLYFYSPIWPICQGMKPIVDRLEKTYGDEFNIVRIDVTRPNGEALLRKYGLVGQPNYIFFDSSNEETRRIAGPQTFEVMAREIEMTIQK